MRITYERSFTYGLKPALRFHPWLVIRSEGSARHESRKRSARSGGGVNGVSQKVQWTFSAVNARSAGRALPGVASGRSSILNFLDSYFQVGLAPLFFIVTNRHIAISAPNTQMTENNTGKSPFRCGSERQKRNHLPAKNAK